MCTWYTTHVAVFGRNIWPGYQHLLDYLSLKCLLSPWRLSPWRTMISSLIPHSLISFTANMKGICISSVFEIGAMMAQRIVAVNNPNRMDAHSSYISAASAADATSNPFYYLTRQFAPSGSDIAGFDSIMDIPILSSNKSLGACFQFKDFQHCLAGQNV